MRLRIWPTEHWTERFSRLAKELPQYGKVRPDSGKLWLDIIYLCFVAAIQFVVDGSLLGRVADIDFITPWLVINWIRMPLAKSMLMAAVGALIIETHSSAPMGLYFSGFFSAVIAITLLKDSISWIYLMPWVSTVAAVCGFAVLLETLAIVLGRDSGQINYWYFFSQFSRLLIAYCSTWIVCHYRFNLRFASLQPIYDENI